MNTLTRFSNVICAKYHDVCLHPLSVQSSHVFTEDDARATDLILRVSCVVYKEEQRRRGLSVLAPVTLSYRWVSCSSKTL